MFALIRRWLGIGPDRSAAQQDALQMLDALAPLKFASENLAPARVNEAQAFICREVVINRQQKIDGYEFSLSPRLQSRFSEKSARVKQVCDDAILRNLSCLGVPSLLGNSQAIIRLSPSALKNPLLEGFSKMNLAILLNPNELATVDRSLIRENLLHLSNLGIRHGWTLDKSWPDFADFCSAADFVEVDSRAFDSKEIKALYRELRAIKGNLKLIASGLQTAEDFNACFHSGFDYFAGSFASNRKNWRPAKSEVNRIRVIEVLNMIRAGAENSAIADRLRTEPLVTFKLLRYINSPGIGLQHKISEISQALVILGADNFQRWLSLLLFDFKNSGFRESVLKEQVLARARFLEMLAGQGSVPAAADLLFITGLFSLMDAMMGQSIEEVLKQVSLPESVAAALSGKSGAMRDALLLSKTVESGTPPEMAAAAVRCRLDAKIVTAAMIEALAWAQRMNAMDE
jgi:EAL and modified HD-GYP domain-containing signal transduction protein